jgi:hypothetical protein
LVRELIVAIPHLALVGSELERLGTTFSDPDRDENLGLALLRLNNLDRAVAAIEQESEGVRAKMRLAREARFAGQPSLAA